MLVLITISNPRAFFYAVLIVHKAIPAVVSPAEDKNTTNQLRKFARNKFTLTRKRYVSQSYQKSQEKIKRIARY